MKRLAIPYNTHACLHALLATFLVTFVCTVIPSIAYAANDEVFLAAFMDRTDGCSDYVYVSRDGKRFERISVAY